MTGERTVMRRLRSRLRITSLHSCAVCTASPHAHVRLQSSMLLSRAVTRTPDSTTAPAPAAALTRADPA